VVLHALVRLQKSELQNHDDLSRRGSQRRAGATGGDHRTVEAATMTITTPPTERENTTTDIDLEKLALEIANLQSEGLSPDQFNEQMKARLGGLDRLDVQMVIQHAAAIAREQGGAKLKEAAVLEASARRKGIL
jgi:hypothetical protein